MALEKALFHVAQGSDTRATKAQSLAPAAKTYRSASRNRQKSR